MNKRPSWLRARKAADEGLEKYRLTWKKELRGVRDCLADEIEKLLLNKNMKLDWFFIDIFLDLANDKGKVRIQKKETVFNYNGKPFTVTFKRGERRNNNGLKLSTSR